MAYIQANHQQLKKTAAEMEVHARTLKSDMRQAHQAVKFLIGKWEGPDAEAFRRQWTAAMEPDSTYIQTVKALESYADYLRFAAEQYRQAQSNAVNRANKLPK